MQQCGDSQQNRWQLSAARLRQRESFDRRDCMKTNPACRVTETATQTPVLMATPPNSLAKLEYKGISIRTADDDFLNLTDMWKACGSDPSKKPADWQRKEGAAFIEFVADSQGVPVEHTLRKEPGNPQKGIGGSTWAHWQIGLAYAKYLSHEFHAFCNKVVRDHIEGAKRAPSPWDRVPNLSEESRKQIAQFVRTVPVASDSKWAWDIIDLFAALYDKPKPDRSKAPPVWFKGVVGRLHKMRFPQPIIDVLREFALGDGSSHRYYQYMQPSALAVLGELQNIVRGVGSQFGRGQAQAAIRAIADHCNAINGMGLQLTLARTCSCGNRVGLSDRFCSQCGAVVAPLQLPEHAN